MVVRLARRPILLGARTDFAIPGVSLARLARLLRVPNEVYLSSSIEGLRWGNDLAGIVRV